MCMNFVFHFHQVKYCEQEVTCVLLLLFFVVVLGGSFFLFVCLLLLFFFSFSFLEGGNYSYYSTACRKGWTVRENSDSCYLFIEEPLPWNIARVRNEGRMYIVQCCFTSTETGRTIKDGHLHFHTAPEL